MEKLGKLFLIVFLLIFGGKVFAFDKTLKIYDYAQKLDQSQEKQIKNDINGFTKKYKTEVIIVTVKFHGELTTKEYADEFYKFHDFGLNDTKDGIIMVIDYGSEELIEIKAYGNTAKVFTEKNINKLKQELINQKTCYKKTEKLLKLSAQILSNGYLDKNINLKNNFIKKIPWLFIIFVSIFIPTIYAVLGLKYYKKINNNIETLDFINVDNLNVIRVEEKFVETKTDTIKINRKK